MKEFRFGLIVNPIAGMGGKVGLKGTDGVLTKAKELGAQPIAPQKAIDMLNEFKTFKTDNKQISWYTCAGDMGQNELQKAGITQVTIVHDPDTTVTTPADTKKATQKMMNKHLDLLIFCGGDGTARDILEIVDKNIPLLGIPAGVKMHSAVFSITTQATAKILYEFINNRLTLGDVEIMDLNEQRYRKGEWNIQLYGIAQGIIEPTYVQVGKSMYESVSENAIRDELAEHIQDVMNDHPHTLFLFGSGGTIDYIAKKLELKNSLLGIDAIYQQTTIQTDVNEKEIITLLTKYHNTKLLLSPIGAQGFILGRGNLQLSPQVINKIGIDNIIVLSTPAKLLHTPMLRVDTGDKKLDRMFAKQEFLMVVIGYRLSRVVKLQTNKY